MKKLTKSISATISDYYPTINQEMTAWEVVLPDLLKKYNKNLKSKISKKVDPTEFLNNLGYDYFLEKHKGISSKSDLSVIRAFEEYYLASFIKLNFKFDQEQETSNKLLLKNSLNNVIFELFGVVKLYALLAKQTYPYTLIKPDIQNYWLKKYKNLSFDILYKYYNKELTTEELNQRWNDKLSKKLNIENIDIPYITEADYKEYKQNLELINAYITILTALPQNSIKHLKNAVAILEKNNIPPIFNEITLTFTKE
jgi:hypothetical protein